MVRNSIRTILCQFLLLTALMFVLISVFFSVFGQREVWGLVFILLSVWQIPFLIIVLIYDWEKIEKAQSSLVQMYCYQTLIVFFVLSVLFWHEGSIALSLYLFVVPIGALTLIDSERSVLFAILALVFFVAIFLVEPLLPATAHYIHMTPQFNSALDVFVILCVLLYLCFFLFWHNKLTLQRQQEWAVSELALIDKEILPPPTAAEQTKFDSLHEKILACFEEKQPYCNPDFDIVELAKMLETNATYIYRTLKEKENINFNTFVNIYRINLIKKLFEEGNEEKYTMAYIYTSAGFRHQSTFNQTFKNIVGMTPSDYIKYKNLKKQ